MSHHLEPEPYADCLICMSEFVPSKSTDPDFQMCGSESGIHPDAARCGYCDYCGNAAELEPVEESDRSVGHYQTVYLCDCCSGPSPDQIADRELDRRRWEAERWEARGTW